MNFFKIIYKDLIYNWKKVIIPILLLFTTTAFLIISFSFLKIYQLNTEDLKIVKKESKKNEENSNPYLRLRINCKKNEEFYSAVKKLKSTNIDSVKAIIPFWGCNEYWKEKEKNVVIIGWDSSFHIPSIKKNGINGKIRDGEVILGNRLATLQLLAPGDNIFLNGTIFKVKIVLPKCGTPNFDKAIWLNYSDAEKVISKTSKKYYDVLIYDNSAFNESITAQIKILLPQYNIQEVKSTKDITTYLKQSQINLKEQNRIAKIKYRLHINNKIDFILTAINLILLISTSFIFAYYTITFLKGRNLEKLLFTLNGTTTSTIQMLFFAKLAIISFTGVISGGIIGLLTMCLLFYSHTLPLKILLYNCGIIIFMIILTLIISWSTSCLGTIKITFMGRKIC